MPRLFFHQTGRFPRCSLRVALVALVSMAFGIYSAPLRAQSPDAGASGPADAPVGYVILIDTSYSMLLDPSGQNGGAVTPRANGGIEQRDGKLIIKAPPPGTLTGGLLERVKNTVESLLRGAAPGTRVAIYQFNSGITGRLLETLNEESRDDVVGYVRSIRASGGETAIYDSVGQALEDIQALTRANELPEKWTIYLFTDGEENASRLGFEEILSRYRLLRSRANKFIFWRYYGPTEAQAAESRQAGELERLAKEPGVQVYDITALEASFEPDTVEVSPPSLTISVTEGRVSEPFVVELQTDPRRKDPIDVRFDAWLPDGTSDGLPARIEPAGVTLGPQEAPHRVALRVAVSESPAEEPVAYRTYRGELRLRSRDPLIFEPQGLAFNVRLVEPQGSLSTGLLTVLLALGVAIGAYRLFRRRSGPPVIVFQVGDEKARLVALEALQGIDAAVVPVGAGERWPEVVRRLRAAVVLTDRPPANGVPSSIPVIMVGGNSEPLDVAEIRSKLREALAS